MNTLDNTSHTILSEQHPLANASTPSAPTPSPAPRRRRLPRPQLPDTDDEPEDPAVEAFRMEHEGQPGNWLRIGYGCFMKKNHHR